MYINTHRGFGRRSEEGRRLLRSGAYVCVRVCICVYVYVCVSVTRLFHYSERPSPPPISVCRIQINL